MWRLSGCTYVFGANSTRQTPTGWREAFQRGWYCMIPRYHKTPSIDTTALELEEGPSKVSEPGSVVKHHSHLVCRGADQDETTMTNPSAVCFPALEGGTAGAVVQKLSCVLEPPVRP